VNKNQFQRPSKSNIPSYSNLLKEIEAGRVENIILIPSRNEAEVKFVDGTNFKIPVLAKDQRFFRIIENSGTGLTIKDIRSEQAAASLISSLGLFIVFFIALIFLIKRSSNFANKTLGFVNGKQREHNPEDVAVSFQDVAGINEEVDEISELVHFLKEPDQFSKLGAKIPKGVLLIGPPGTGKTLLARAIAGEAGVPFYSVSASEFVEMFVGIGASRVRNLFLKAKEKSPSIIFIDEIDAIGRQRGSGIGGGNDEREQTLNQLLTEMDGFADNAGTIVLAATNRPDVLDKALLRPGRFDRQIQVLLPDRKGRLGILGVHARTKPLDKEVSLNDWAIRTPGFSGADLENFLNEAAILCARKNNKRINNEDLESSLGRISTGITLSPLQNSSMKKIIAYNEVGKAVALTLTSNKDKVEKITILPTGNNIGGYTSYSLDEETIDSGLYTRKYFFNKLIIYLSGRATEILIMGKNEVTQAGVSDINYATSLAKDMVVRFGFSKLGPISLDNDANQIFLGKDLISKKSEYAETTSMLIDQSVIELINDALNQAIHLLNPYIHKIDLIANILIDKETIHSKTFYEIFNKD